MGFSLLYTSTVMGVDKRLSEYPGTVLFDKSQNIEHMGLRHKPLLPRISGLESCDEGVAPTKGGECSVGAIP